MKKIVILITSILIFLILSFLFITYEEYNNKILIPWKLNTFEGNYDSIGELLVTARLYNSNLENISLHKDDKIFLEFFTAIKNKNSNTIYSMLSSNEPEALKQELLNYWLNYELDTNLKFLFVIYFHNTKIMVFENEGKTRFIKLHSENNKYKLKSNQTDDLLVRALSRYITSLNNNQQKLNFLDFRNYLKQKILLVLYKDKITFKDTKYVLYIDIYKASNNSKIMEFINMLLNLSKTDNSQELSNYVSESDILLKRHPLSAITFLNENGFDKPQDGCIMNINKNLIVYLLNDNNGANLILEITGSTFKILDISTNNVDDSKFNTIKNYINFQTCKV